MGLQAVAAVVTIATGVMAFQQSRQQAAMLEIQADMRQRQAQQQAAVTQMEIGQQELAREAEELRTREQANRMRRAARQQEQAAYAAMAGRGLQAIPFGSFGAILGDAEEELYRDLDANRTERGFKEVASLTRLAGTAAAGAQSMATARYEAGAALADAKTARISGWTRLAGSLVDAYRIAPSL